MKKDTNPAMKSEAAIEAQKVQINVRLTQDELDLIDNKRIEEKKSKGAIPTRSDVIRDAIAAYCGKTEGRRKG